MRRKSRAPVSAPTHKRAHHSGPLGSADVTVGVVAKRSNAVPSVASVQGTVGSRTATSLNVSMVKVYAMSVITDCRGSLSFGELNQPIPFEAKRYFVVYDVKDGFERGRHAHRKCHQFVVCVAGSVLVTVDDGKSSDSIALGNPSVGIHVPPLVWTTLSKFSENATVLVLASEIFRESDYIRSYDLFLREVAGK